MRGEESRDALRRESIKLIQEEEDLSAQIYNGRITALLVLEDVRPGDVIDYDYSLSGSNPVFGEHFSDDVALASAQLPGSERPGGDHDRAARGHRR